MRPLNAVIAQSSAKAIEQLIKPLNQHFRSVYTAHDLQELRAFIAGHHADVAIVDLELITMEQLRQLATEFAGATIICTHRLADERLWTDALEAGADFDVRAIVLAASRHGTQTAPRVA